MRQYSALWASWALTLAATLAAATNVGGHETAATSVPQVSAERLAIAESVLEREEAASTRMFDESFRARALATIASLPMEVLLQAETQENGGLGLNVLGDTQADLVYTPVTPCRILDTRVAGGTIGAGTTRDFRVTGTSLSSQGGSATGCGVPYGPVTAAVINFAAVNPAGPGNVRMTPYGNPIPKAA